jgi:hypothetical protein
MDRQTEQTPHRQRTHPSGATQMSHQESKSEAIRVIRELLKKHPPGMVIMILRELKTILRATKDITIYKDKE